MINIFIFRFALREKCLYSELFWSVFSRIRTEYGEILVCLRIQSECGKIRTRITPNTDTFYEVVLTLKLRIIIIIIILPTDRPKIIPLAARKTKN